MPGFSSENEPHSTHRSPWHAGEVRLQESLGMAQRMAQVGSKVVRPYMPDQTRRPRVPADAPPEHLDQLDAAARESVARADTFFVASFVDVEGSRQVDVSHRGGAPGFVRVDSDGMLTIPDYSGNRFFNTLGNLLLNPQAGLLFPDFETGDVLQMTGVTRVLLDVTGTAEHQGAERLWTFVPSTIVRRRGALPLRWTLAATIEP